MSVEHAALIYLRSQVGIGGRAFRYAIGEENPNMLHLTEAARDLAMHRWIFAVDNIDLFCRRTGQEERGSEIVRRWRDQQRGPMFNYDTVPSFYR